MEREEVESRINKAKKLMFRNWDPRRPITLSERQKSGSSFFLSKDDAFWTSQVSIVMPEDNEIRQRCLDVVTDLDEAHSHFDVALPRRLAGEWVGARLDYQRVKPSTVQSEADRYKHLEAGINTPITVLYVHGGGFVTGSPSFSRQRFSCRIARLTGGKCFAVQYRLSPQHLFPSALLDLLLSYLNLLYPLPGAYHPPIPHQSIVLAGDSAGANLCLSFTQLLLRLRQQFRHISFNKATVPLPLPAGVSCISGYLDNTDCMPSITSQVFDYFRNPKLENAREMPPDAIWPSTPARESVYCADEQLTHQLISPMCADDWTGAPPMWISTGEEIVSDSNKVVAQRATSQQVPVWWRYYEAVPHVWHLIPGLEEIPQTEHVMKDWAEFCRYCVMKPGVIRTSAKVMRRRDFRVEEVSMHSLLDMTFHDARKQMKKKAKKLRKQYELKDVNRALKL